MSKGVKSLVFASSRTFLSCRVEKRSTATRAKSRATWSSVKVISSSCGGRWTRTGSTASWTAATDSFQPVTSSASGRCPRRRRRGKPCTTSRSKTKTRTKTVWPSLRYTLITIWFLDCIYVIKNTVKIKIIYFCDAQLYFQHHYSSLQCHMIFRNHNNMLICCSRNIYDYYQCWKQLCCTIFLWKLMHFIFQDSQMNRKFKRTAFICNICNIINVFNDTFDQFNVSLMNKSIYFSLFNLFFNFCHFHLV